MAGWRGGTLVNTVRARRRRFGIAGVALALLALVLPAFADTPQAGTDPSVTLTVSPSTGLADGQIVTVTGTGFPASSAGTLRACGGTVTAPQCDLTTTTPFVTTAAGTIQPTAFAVKRVVEAGATTFNCGVQPCALVATAEAKSARHQIAMAGAGTVVTTTSTTTPSPTTSTTTNTTTTSPTTTSTVASTTTSTSSPGSTTTVLSNGCDQLRWTQRDAIAAIDALIAAFPEFRDVGAQARQATNAKLAQALAAAGC